MRVDREAGLTLAMLETHSARVRLAGDSKLEYARLFRLQWPDLMDGFKGKRRS